MSILVTGGAGYIGSHTCIELLNAGEQVIILDNFVNSKPVVLDKIREITGKDFLFYEADLLDEAAVDRVFAENDIDSVIHFAGLKAVGESVTKPLLYYHNNITGTLNLCKAMEKYGVKKLVFSSSATVYGHPETCPVKEDFPLSASNPYGQTKLMIEQMIRDFAFADETWSAAILRYFNPLGAHESGLIGEDPNGIPNNLVPYVARVAAGKYPQLTVFGNDYDTPDGTCIRDYIHVVDLAKGHLSALNWIRKNNGAEAFNLGTGNGNSVLEVVAAFEKASGRKVPYVIGERRPGNADAASSYSDPSKAEKVLGWKAEKNLEDMCRDSWRFTEKNPNGL